MIERLFLWASLAVAFALCVPAAAQPVHVPGTTVTMAPPPGFTMATTFAGFEQPDTESSITINEFPKEALADLTAMFSGSDVAAKRWAGQGVQVTGRSTVSAAGSEVPILTGSQTVNDVTVRKFIALLSGARVVMVTLNLVGTDTTGSQAVAAITSIRLGAEPSMQETLGLLSFTFEAAAPFRVRDVQSRSTALLSISAEADPTGAQPVIAIASSLASVDEQDLEALSEQMLRGTRGFAVAVITVAEPVQFAGGAGYRLDAATRDRSIVHYLRVLPDGQYVRLVARGETAALDAVKDEVAATAASVRIRGE